MIIGINIVARRTEQGPALGWIDFGNLLVERVQMDMRHFGVEKTVKPLDESEDFNLELVAARHRSLNGRIKRGRIAASRENSDAFHERAILLCLRADRAHQ